MFRDAFKLRTLPDTKHLTSAECIEIVVKRYQRFSAKPVDASVTPDLFSEVV